MRTKLLSSTLGFFLFPFFACILLSVSFADSSVFFDFSKRIQKGLLSDSQNLDPDEIQALIDSSEQKNQNQEQKEEKKAKLLKPAEEMGVRILDGQIGLVRRFLAMQIAQKITNSNLANGLHPKASEVVNSMSLTELASANSALSQFQIKNTVKEYLPKENKSFFASEGRFLLTAMISALIDLGIYEGLDVNSMKNRVLSLKPVPTHSTITQNFIPSFLGSVANRHLQSFFNQKFDLFYDKMLGSQSFGKSIEILLNKSRVKSSLKTVMESSLGKTISSDTVVNASSVANATGFTLKGFLKSISTGLAYGIVLDLVVDSVTTTSRGYYKTALVNQNRSAHVDMDSNSFRFQKNSNEIKNWMNERKYALMDLFDNYKKAPLSKIAGSVGKFAALYAGSVLTGAIFVGGGVPAMIGGAVISSLFSGVETWMKNTVSENFEKSDMVRGIRRRFLEDRLYKAIICMSGFQNQRIDETRARELSKERAFDMYKKESHGSFYDRMFLVESLEAVEIYQNQDYLFMRSSSNNGEIFDMQAHIRWEIFDIDGNEGRFDLISGKIFNVGNVAKNSGRDIHFVTDDDTFVFEGEYLNHIHKGSHLRVLTNGLVMTLHDSEPQKWVARGLSHEIDIFLRVKKLRLSWDENKKAYKIVDSEFMHSENLHLLLSCFQKENWREELNAKTAYLLYNAAKQAKKKIEALDTQKEEIFFYELEKVGAEKQVKEFRRLEFGTWKTILLGKLDRFMPGHISRILENFSAKAKTILEKELQKELQKERKTVYDLLQSSLEPIHLISACLMYTPQSSSDIQK